MSARKSGDFIADGNISLNGMRSTPTGTLPNAISPLSKPLVSCSLNIRCFTRSLDFLIRVCATGDSSSSFARFKSASSFTKSPGKTFCRAAPCTETAIYRDDWLNRRKRGDPAYGTNGVGRSSVEN